MSTERIQDKIRKALASVPSGDFPTALTDLLDALGYRSQRTLAGQTGATADFIQQFPAQNPGTQSEREFLDNARSVRILFQFTSDEVQAETQQALFDASGFNQGNARSFMFIAVELNGDIYPRGQYAAFTREINRRLTMPSVILFRTSVGSLSLAFVHRRPNRRGSKRDVLGNVALIRQIDAASPHRAHLDILAELSLPQRLDWMRSHGKPTNFDGLLDAWLDALDTEALNRRFYRELFQWFQRAVDEAKLPASATQTVSRAEHVIRLITRLLFVWFIKEKGLVAEELFTENQVNALLQGYDRDNGDCYYRAVLQNLFFATLNTEIADRRFSKQTQGDHRNFSVYRYRQEIADPNALMALFDQTPFINGGLFDCLDSFDATGAGGVRVDCFTDNARHRAGYAIPNRLFFGDNDNPGLIDLFKRYKFTVEENTPTEQEVALDPELLGKVFENLLAAVNPETQRTARKETGSYYTPRAVVDYMVDEALVATLAQKASPDDDDADYWQARLHYLLDYGDAFADAETLFHPPEREGVVRAIAGIKALDPAVGSGAFPMGILHKLTLALRRLDPDNRIWEGLQKELASKRATFAFDTADQAERDAELQEISATFQKYRDSDFGRKLCLIQNSIYGVDIQPIATQIAKLRFFISLAIEQQPNDDQADNYGIRPLPNLETRFVAADTLRALEKPAQMTLGDTVEVQRLEAELAANRERYFHANSRAAKRACRAQDAELREQLAATLQTAGFPAASATQVAAWDPFDQNANAAGWFDAEYMFGVNKGFDIVIGNPPYRQIKKGTYPKAWFPFSEGRDKGKQNLYKLFVEQSHNLCKNNGVATLIVQGTLMCDLSSSWTRRLLLERAQLRHVIEFPERARFRQAQVFSSVTQGTCIYQFRKALPNGDAIKISVGNDAQSVDNPQFAEIAGNTIATLWPELRCLPRIKQGAVAILQRIASNDAIRPLRYYASSIVQGDLNLTSHKAHFSSTLTPVRLMRGDHVSRFVIRYDAATEYCDVEFRRNKVDANRRETFLISQEVMNQQAARRLNFAMTTESENDFLWGHSVNKTQLREPANTKAFLALLNSQFMDWYFRITSSNNHVQGYELEQLPIPTMTAVDRRQLTKIVDRILAAKAGDPAADTSADEAEIDRLVYGLYGLTEGEIAAVEGH